MLSDVPPPLAAVFEKQVTVSTAQLRELLPMSAKMLQAHVRLGHLEYVDFGTTDGPSQRHFTLEHVLRFINSRSFREVPRTYKPSREAIVRAEPINKDSYTLRLAVQREAQQAELRRQYKAAVAEYGHFSKRLPPMVGLSQSPLAFAARKHLREEARARKEAEKATAAAARLAKKGGWPPQGEDPDAVRKRLATERRRRVAERSAEAKKGSPDTP